MFREDVKRYMNRKQWRELQRGLRDKNRDDFREWYQRQLKKGETKNV
jgi:hypothetical protein